jgi:hypothetical protein
MNTSAGHQDTAPGPLRRIAGGAAVASGYAITIYALYALLVAFAGRVVASGAVFSF